MKYTHVLKAPIQNIRFQFWTRLTLLAVVAAGCIGIGHIANAASPAQATAGPSIERFFPIATVPGRSIIVTGKNLPTSEKGSTLQAFFGGANLIPATFVRPVSATQFEVGVPETGVRERNINGYLTFRVNGRDITTQNLGQAVTNPGDEASVFNEFVLLGDLDGNGLRAEAKDVTLARAFYITQVQPTMRQFIAAKVFPVNANKSRGNSSPVNIDDFNAIREVSLGRASF